MSTKTQPSNGEVRDDGTASSNAGIGATLRDHSEGSFDTDSDAAGFSRRQCLAEDVALVVTGGTIDLTYDEPASALRLSKSQVVEMLRIGRVGEPQLGVSVHVPMLVDSSDMTDEHRLALLASCTSVPERRIVVTHGTNTMTTTAEFLQAKAIGKTIVLTGSIVPFALRDSDSMFNLGTAVAFAQSLPPGVYIAMNGRSFVAGRVAKDWSTRTFMDRHVPPPSQKRRRVAS